MALCAEVTKNEYIIISEVIYCGSQLVIGLLISQEWQFSVQFYNNTHYLM